MVQLQPSEVELYGLLNLTTDATTEQIQRAYKSLSRTFHPDRLKYQSDLETAQETFVEIKNAHEILCDPVRRFAYDEHGWKGIGLLSTLSKIPKNYFENHQDFHLSSWIGLEEELRELLARYHENKDVECVTEAKRILQEAVEEYQEMKENIALEQQRAPLKFEGTFEYPCTYDYYDPNNMLEMESAYLSCMVRRATKITRRPQQPKKQQEEASDSSSSDNNKNDKDTRTTTTMEPPKVQLLTSSMGTTVEWDHTGKADISSSVELGYKLNPQSQLSFVLNTPLNHRMRRPLQHKVALSTTHEFSNGTGVVLGLRGNTNSLRGWSYSLMSQRILLNSNSGTTKAANNNNTAQDDEDDNDSDQQKTKLYASWALGMLAMDGKVAYCLTTFKTIPPVSSSVKRQLQKQQQQQQQQRSRRKHQHNHPRQEQKQQSFHNNGISVSSIKTFVSSLVPSWWSIPVLKLKLGLPAMSCSISSNFDYFGYEWLSLYTSMAWNASGVLPKAKMLLSYQSDALSTIIKTGFRHDDLSGWIWLWEWEEDNWSFCIPVSISSSSFQLEGGEQLGLADYFHNSIYLSLMTCTTQIVWSMFMDMYKGNNRGLTTKLKEKVFPKSEEEDDEDFFDTNASGSGNGSGGRTLRMGDKNNGSNNSSDDYYRHQILQRMIPIAEKKRQLEEETNGLVILFAKRSYYFGIPPTKKEQQQQPQGRQKQQEQMDYFGSGKKKNVHEIEDDLTCQLQFWVVDGKLCLPLSDSNRSWIGIKSSSSNVSATIGKQQFPSNSPQEVNAGGTRYNNDNDDSWLWWSQTWWSALLWRPAYILSSVLARGNNTPPAIVTPKMCHTTRIRYKSKGYVYEIEIDDEEKMLVLPNPNSQCLGLAGVVT